MAEPQININVINCDEIQWIHCNSCIKLYEKVHVFYLLSCSHVMCRKCFKMGGRNPFCTVCKKHVSFRAINRELEPKYLDLFKLDMTYDSYAEEFQYKHALDLAKKIARTERIAEENKIQMNKLIEYNEYYKQLRAERKQKQVKLKKIYAVTSGQNRTNLNPEDFVSEFGSSNAPKSSSVLSQSSSSFSIPSIINKATLDSSFQTESSKKFFQNRASSSGNKLPYRKEYDLTTKSKFNKYFKPPTKSTPL